MSSDFCGNQLQDILKELAQWSVEGDDGSDDDISPGGCFYEEARAEITNALIRGSMPVIISDSTPIAFTFLGALHRKMTALLYIQSRQIQLTVDGQDSTRGMWAAIRRKLASIANGEQVGELTSSKGSASTASLYMIDPAPMLPMYRGL